MHFGGVTSRRGRKVCLIPDHIRDIFYSKAGFFLLLSFAKQKYQESGFYDIPK
jgi:hypothetical protein